MAFASKMMDVAFKLMDFAFKLMDVVFKLMDFAFKLMGVVFKLMDFASKMMGVVFKLMNFVFKLMGVVSEGVRRCRCRVAAVAAALVASMLIKKSLCAVGTFSLPAPLLMPME